VGLGNPDARRRPGYAYSFHDLRHTHAALALAAWVHPEVCLGTPGPCLDRHHARRVLALDPSDAGGSGMSDGVTGGKLKHDLQNGNVKRRNAFLTSSASSATRRRGSCNDQAGESSFEFARRVASANARARVQASWGWRLRQAKSGSLVTTKWRFQWICGHNASFERDWLSPCSSRSRRWWAGRRLRRTPISITPTWSWRTTSIRPTWGTS
jgi:hypothetical protein